MDRNSVDWNGAMPALTTPFDSEGGIDFDAYAANVERQMAAGATGFVVAGCTGEFWALSNEERAELARTTVETAAGRATVIVGTGSVLPDDVIAQSRAAEQAGADGVLVLPPYFVHATERELLHHFSTIDKGSALPIVLYNIPGNAGNALHSGLADRLADLDKVVAIKESSGDWGNFHRTLIAARDRIRVFCGPSSVFGMAAVQAGADGLIDCFPNVWTDCLDLWSATLAGKLAEARTLQATGIALTDLFVSGGRTLYPSTKAAMDHLGLPGGGTPRLPLRPLEGSPLQELKDGLDAILERAAQARTAEQAG